MYTAGDDFLLRANTLEETIKEKGVPRFVIINSPNNPAGTVYSLEELEKVIRLSRERGFGIIFDECYHHFSSPEIDFREMCSEAIVVNSCSKTYGMTGWRIGWAVAPTETIDGMRDFFRKVIGSISSVSQEAAIEALRGEERIENFSEQRELIQEWMDDLEIPYPEPAGGFYVFPDFSCFMNGEIMDSVGLANYLLKEAGVAVAPGELFGDYPGRLRIAYCMDKETLKEGLNRIKRILLK
jgi:aspartate/methionine/tyrosine aminotransferase